MGGLTTVEWKELAGYARGNRWPCEDMAVLSRALTVSFAQRGARLPRIGWSAIYGHHLPVPPSAAAWPSRVLAMRRSMMPSCGA